MKRLRAQGVVSVSELKSSPSKIIKAVTDDGPVVVTVDGKPALVCITPADYDRWVERDFVLARIEEAEAAIQRGDRTYTTAELREQLAQRRAAKPAPGQAPASHDDSKKVAK